VAQLRIEADEANSKVEELKAKVKALEQENLSKEQEVTSLTHKNQLLEAEVEKLEQRVKEAKTIAEENRAHGTQNETLQRRLQLLEEEAEEADRNLRETNDKYICHPAASPMVQDHSNMPGPLNAFPRQTSLSPNHKLTPTPQRLRQTDVKSGHYERKVAALEASRDQWETKYEEMSKKYSDVKKELDEYLLEIGNI
jgi:tropomyosin, fungi type